MKEKINQIIEAIGSNAPEDYILAPQTHAEKYHKSLPELSHILKKSNVKHFANEYKINDRKAIDAQSKFKKFSSLSRLFIFLTAVFSTTLLISGSLSGIDFIDNNLKWFPGLLLMISTVLAILFGAISTALLKIIKDRKLLEKWMELRSEAEELRINYFKEMASTDELKISIDYLTVLEYFRRYQLDIQLNYYSFRATQLENKSNIALNILAILAAIVLVINGITGMLGLEWSSLAALAIIIQNYAFMINNKELNDQNARNAERYSRTRSVLSKLKSQIDDVRKAITQDDTSILFKFINAVQEPISLENRQWLKSMRSSSMAIDELEKQLEKIKQKDEK